MKLKEELYLERQLHQTLLLDLFKMLSFNLSFSEIDNSLKSLGCNISSYYDGSACILLLSLLFYKLF